MLCYGMLRYAINQSINQSISLSLSLSLSLSEGSFYLKSVLNVPFSVYLEAFVNCSSKIT